MSDKHMGFLVISVPGHNHSKKLFVAYLKFKFDCIFFRFFFSSGNPVLKKVLVFCQLTDASQGPLKDYIRQFFFSSWFLKHGQSLYHVSRLLQPILACVLPPASVTLGHSQYCFLHITESGKSPRTPLSHPLTKTKKTQIQKGENLWSRVCLA